MSNDNSFTVSHSSYYCFLPELKEIRSRVAIYARKKSRFQLNLRLDLLSDSDVLYGEIIDIKNELNSIHLFNIYNEKFLIKNNNSWMISRAILNRIPEKHSIFTEDFNTHCS